MRVVRVDFRSAESHAMDPWDPSFAGEADAGDAHAVDRASIGLAFPSTETSAVNRVVPIAIAIALLTSASANGQPAVEMPRFTVGDRWTLRVTDLQKDEETQSFENRVTTVAGDTIGVAWKILSSTTAGDVGKQGTTRFDASNWSFKARREGALVALAFPLEVGKTWEYAYVTRNSTGGETTTTMKAKVEGWEEIRVPAGTFRALKVVHEGQWAGRNHFGEGISNVIRDTYWYVPEIKRAARREYFVRSRSGAVSTNTRTDIVSTEFGK